METSQTIGKLSEALAKAQGEMENALFDKVNPFFNSKYATLACVLDTIKKPLADNGLAISQGAEIETKEGISWVMVTTLLSHSSGEWIKTRLGLKPVFKTKGGGTEIKDDPQSLASVISYGRRYCVSAIVSVASDEDDDANVASGKSPSREAEKPKENPKNDLRCFQIKEIMEISQKLGQNGDEMRLKIGNFLNLGKAIKSSMEIPELKVSEVLAFFKKCLAEKEEKKNEDHE